MPAAFQSKIVVYRKIVYAARANRALRIIHRTLSKTDLLFRKPRNITKYISGSPVEKAIQNKVHLVHAASKQIS